MSIIQRIGKLERTVRFLNSKGGSEPIEVTAEDLFSKIAASELEVGYSYLVTDFKTVHYVVDGWGTIHTGSILSGSTEPLIVTAAATNKLDKKAISTIYPQDEIYVSFDSSKWLKDKSFASGGVIVPGWKGTIYYRKDTLRNNSFGYDFRNVKFRRWKANTAADQWLAGTSYGTWTTGIYNAGVYYNSLRASNVGNTPASSPLYWTAVANTNTTLYICDTPSGFNGTITGISNDYQDFYTFVTNGETTYEKVVTNNVFANGYDNDDLDLYNETILPNIVFFLGGLITGNYFGPAFVACTFTNADVFLNRFEGNSANNLIDGSISENQISGRFDGNMVASGMNYNHILSNFSSNGVGINFEKNRCAAWWSGNNVGANMQFNVFGHNFSSNRVGNDFTWNDIKGNVYSNTIKNQFTSNTVYPNINGKDMTAYTTVYANNYSKELIFQSDFAVKVKYVNAAGTQIISAP